MTLLELDTALFYVFNNLPHNRYTDGLAALIHVATYGGTIYYPIALAFLFSKRPKLVLLAKLGFIAGFSGWLVTEVIVKHIVGRLRPYQTLDVFFLTPPPMSYSFPSGQTATAFMIATLFLLILQGKRRWITGLMFAFAVLVGIDRMFMGHHYFFDVLVGGMIGSFMAWFIYFIMVSSREKTPTEVGKEEIAKQATGESVLSG